MRTRRQKKSIGERAGEFERKAPVPRGLSLFIDTRRAYLNGLYDGYLAGWKAAKRNRRKA
jgi:hypothetical protein